MLPNVDKLTYLDEHEQRLLLFYIMEAMRKDNNIFKQIKGIATDFASKNINEQSIVKVSK